MILTMMMMIQKIYRSHKLIVMAIGVLVGLKVAMTPMLMRLVTGDGKLTPMNEKEQLLKDNVFSLRVLL